MDQARELVNALVASHIIEDDDDVIEYLIDNIAEAAAMLTASLQLVLDFTVDDERTLL